MVLWLPFGVCGSRLVEGERAAHQSMRGAQGGRRRIARDRRSRRHCVIPARHRVPYRAGHRPRLRTPEEDDYRPPRFSMLQYSESVGVSTVSPHRAGGVGVFTACGIYAWRGPDKRAAVRPVTMSR